MSINDIYNKIDDLDNTQNLNDLIRKLKPILAELAYYSITGDGAIMEMRENWHSNFTGYIREAVQSSGGSNLNDGRSQPRSSSGQPRSSGQSRSSGGQSRRSRDDSQSIQTINSAQIQQQPRTSNSYYQPPTFYQQQAPNYNSQSLPSSLDSIMRGTHASFSENY